MIQLCLLKNFILKGEFNMHKNIFKMPKKAGRRREVFVYFQSVYGWFQLLS